MSITPHNFSKSAEVNIETLYEDDHLLIVNKPPMILSQKSLDPKRITIEDLVKAQRPDLHLFLHHRLDKETSGVFLLSKSKVINSALTDMFKNHRFQRTYWCLSFPNPLEPNKKIQCQVLDLNSTCLSNKSSSLNSTIVTEGQHWVIKNHMAPATFKNNSPKKRMISVKAGGWYAETEFKILKTFANYFLIEAKPKTGRTHQIRQHLQESHRSLIGDELYGGGKSKLVSRLMLHAYELEFTHPRTEENLKIQAPLPEDFQKLIT